MNRSAVRPLVTLVVALALALSTVLVFSGASEAARRSLIQGIVLDQFGQAVDDVSVVALDDNGDPAASAYTYASSNEDGPQHGYFYLLVPAGTYTLTLSKDGYRRLTYDDVEVTRRRATSLGEIEIQKKLESTKTFLGAQERYSVKKKVEVSLTVIARSTRRPTGTVIVKEGRQTLARVKLRERDRGRLDIDLGRMERGDHVIRASYSGSSSLKESTSNRAVFEVVKPRRHRRPLLLRSGAPLPHVW